MSEQQSVFNKVLKFQEKEKVKTQTKMRLMVVKIRNI